MKIFIRQKALLMPIIVIYAAIVSCSAVEFILPPTPTLTPTPTSTSTPTPTVTPSPSPTPTPPSFLFRITLKEGDILHIRMNSDQEISQDLGTQTQEILQTIGYEYSYVVTEVDPDGNFWVDVTYDRIIIEQDNPIAPYEYDSSNPPEEIPPEAIGYHAMVGKGFSILISPQGQTLDIEGLDEMYDSVLDEMEIEDEGMRLQVEEMLNSQFGEEALMNQTSSIVIDYPDDAIRVGDSWTGSMESVSPFPMIVQTTYTLISLEGDTALLELASTISPHPDAEPLDLIFAQFEYNLSGEQEGTVEYDTQTGWVRYSTITQTMSGDMIMTMEGEKITIPMTLDAVTIVELIE